MFSKSNDTCNRSKVGIKTANVPMSHPTSESRYQPTIWDASVSDEDDTTRRRRRWDLFSFLLLLFDVGWNLLRLLFILCAHNLITWERTHPTEQSSHRAQVLRIGLDGARRLDTVPDYLEITQLPGSVSGDGGCFYLFNAMRTVRRFPLESSVSWLLLVVFTDIWWDGFYWWDQKDTFMISLIAFRHLSVT